MSHDKRTRPVAERLQPRPEEDMDQYRARVRARAKELKCDPVSITAQAEDLARWLAAKPLDPAAADRAVKNFRADPCQKTAMALCLETGKLMVTGIMSPGPTLGVLEIIFESGLMQAGAPEQHAQCGQAAAQLRTQLEETLPTWNDYYMMRWMLTGERAALVEIHRRHKHIQVAASDALMAMIHEGKPDADDPWREVVGTCQWMVGSMRGQDQVFAAELDEVERTCELCKGDHADSPETGNERQGASPV